MNSTTDPGTPVDNVTLYTGYYTVQPTAKTEFGVSAMLCFLIGGLGNILILSYFCRKLRNKRSASSVIYLIISSIDLLCCFLQLFIGLSNFNHSSPTALFQNIYLCNVWGVLWNIASRMSVFSIGILSFSRTLTFVYPLRGYFSRVRHVVLPVGLYLGLMVVQAGVPFYGKVTYNYNTYYCFCTWFVDELIALGTIEYKIVNFVLTDLEFIIPCFLILASCLTSIYFLRVENPELSCNVDEARKATYNMKRKATKTIIILTVVYIMLNMPTCLYYISLSLNSATNGKLNWWDYIPAEKLENFLIIHFMPVNASINTIIYFWRMRDLQNFTISIFLKFKYCLLCKENTGTLDMSFYNGHTQVTKV